MIATKDQERKALEKIKKIVNDLGEESYLSTAFDGCFEIAKENIENDFARNFKKEKEAVMLDLEAAEKNLVEADNKINKLKDQIEKLNDQIEKIKSKQLMNEEINDLLYVVTCYSNDTMTDKAEFEKQIIDLADNPDNIKFKNAVESHRECIDSIDMCKRLVNRLYKVRHQ